MIIAVQYIILIVAYWLTQCTSNETSDSIYHRVIYCLFLYTLLKDGWPFIFLVIFLHSHFWAALLYENMHKIKSCGSNNDHILYSSPNSTQIKITKQSYTTGLSQHNSLQELCYSLTPQQYSTENFGAFLYNHSEWSSALWKHSKRFN